MIRISFLALLLSLAVSASHAVDRVALVIGNSAYKVSPLANPRNDADAMAELLTKAGFQVEHQVDTDLVQMKAAVDRFGVTIRDPKIKFGLFYYAGHGLQQDWRNYLVPVSANIRSASDVPKQTVDVSDLLRYMEKAEGRSFLVILDACRDDPFAGGFTPAAKGLSQFNAPAGSLLAYATAPGNVALDGDGVGKNGLYTGYLLRELAVQGVPVEDAFKRVSLSVRLASKGAQVPWVVTSLSDNIQIFPLRSRDLSEADREQLLEKEMSTWLRVKSSVDPEVLAGFIREYPSGSASELAQSRMNRLLAAMVERESQLAKAAAQAATQAAAEAAQALALREEARRQRVAQAQEKRLAAERAEQERLRMVQAEAARDEALRQQAALQAAQLAEAARLDAQRAQAAELEVRRIAAVQAEAGRVAAAKAEADRTNELARQSQLQAQAAQVEAQRMQELQAQNAASERARLAQVEQARLEQLRLADAQQREADRLAAQLQPTIVVASAAVPALSVPATPFFKGYAEHQRNYSPGDEINIRVIDAFTKASKPLVMKVSQVDLAGERVSFNDGEFVSDLMGNITTNRVGVLSTPRQFYPAELIVGKRWRTRFKQSRANGVTFTYQYDLKVVARERITVPAGTFETYKIEAVGYNLELGARLERNIWVAPGVNADIAHEIKVRLRNGNWDQNDRQELVSYVQAKP